MGIPQPLDHQPPNPRGSRVHICSQRALTGHLLCARLSSGPWGFGIAWSISGVPGAEVAAERSAAHPSAPPSVAHQPWAHSLPIPSPVPWSLPLLYLKDTALPTPCIICCPSTAVSPMSRMLCAPLDPTFVPTDPQNCCPHSPSQSLHSHFAQAATPRVVCDFHCVKCQSPPASGLTCLS